MTNRHGNVYLWIAAILTVLAALAHTIGGEMTSIDALLNASLSATAQVELRAVWHLYSAVLIGCAWILLRGASNHAEHTDLIRVLAVLFLSGGVIWVGVVLLMSTEYFVSTPQWALLLVIGALIAAGQRRSHPQKN